MEISEREQLLNRRFTANSDMSIDIDYSVQHHNAMQNAHRGVDEMINSGEREYCTISERTYSKSILQEVTFSTAYEISV